MLYLTVRFVTTKSFWHDPPAVGYFTCSNFSVNENVFAPILLPF